MDLLLGRCRVRIFLRTLVVALALGVVPWSSSVYAGRKGRSSPRPAPRDGTLRAERRTASLEEREGPSLFETQIARRWREGVDFEVEIKSHPQSPLAIVAIHGGILEPGSDELAREVYEIFSLWGRETPELKFPLSRLYVYRALHSAGHPDEAPFTNPLRLSSVRFDDPRLLRVLEKPVWHALSIHGDGSAGEFPRICLGGGSDIAVKNVLTALQNIMNRGLLPGLVVEYPCSQYPGQNPRNVVNLPQDRGVQIEMNRFLSEMVKGSLFVRRTLANGLAKALVAGLPHGLLESSLRRGFLSSGQGTKISADPRVREGGTDRNQECEWDLLMEEFSPEKS